jgi:hypothetical protein
MPIVCHRAESFAVAAGVEDRAEEGNGGLQVGLRFFAVSLYRTQAVGQSRSESVLLVVALVENFDSLADFVACAMHRELLLVMYSL